MFDAHIGAPEGATIMVGSHRESGGIGRRAGFRCQWGNPWEFESPLSHQPEWVGPGAGWVAGRARDPTVEPELLYNPAQRAAVPR